jgi:hypothetical protein
VKNLFNDVFPALLGIAIVAFLAAGWIALTLPPQ